ncbi:hypothetical protein RvY_02804 [Ramazzottius varieornatus]|uniref:Chromatin modification-related protein MEAF6 n=1 Tax=Ramazzottius varieornatus TaxID=947166 RepID=A0A1D1UL08_RAMVA|nr:hypothetical protein RvY_02804 [Ramazzottius varieornatus]
MADNRNPQANLRNIATTGFDNSPSHTSGLSHDHPLSLSTTSTSGATDLVQLLTPSAMDHPKLAAQQIHFLKDVDISLPLLAGEGTFATALASRNNPTTIDNIHRKLTVLPSNYHTFTREQQDAFCKLVDLAEMKQALRLELRNKEKVIREQEQKYLMADFGLGNVVYGWDVTNPSAVTTGTERTQAAAALQGRLATRRKVKDSDRIFSSSSVMSSSAGANRLSKNRRLELKKKKRQRELMEKQKRLQKIQQRRQMGYSYDEGRMDSPSESFAYRTPTNKGTTYTDSPKYASGIMGVKKSVMIRRPKELGKMGTSSGKLSHTVKMPKAPGSSSSKPLEKPMEGNRLRTLLSNKGPPSNLSTFPGHSQSSSDGSVAGTSREPQQPIKLKIPKLRLFSQDLQSETPSSPSPSVATIDSANSDAPNAHRRNRGRPKRLDT